jgi:hypothetical protein
MNELCMTGTMTSLTITQRHMSQTKGVDFSSAVAFLSLFLFVTYGPTAGLHLPGAAGGSGVGPI